MGQLTLWRFGLIHVLFHSTRFGETPFCQYNNFAHVLALMLCLLFFMAHPLNSLQEYMVFYFSAKCFVNYGWVIVNPKKK
jgi:hypothetical protein